MPELAPPQPANSTPSAWSLILHATLVGLISTTFFATGLTDEPFVDEYAYITQSYQPDRLFAGQTNDASWLEGVSYDLVPLPKYLINVAYRVAGITRPSREHAAAWYQNTSYRWGSTRELIVARLPFVFLGGMGCVAIFAMGTVALDRRAGWIAAILLAWNPLYRLHAHRAMSEAPCEALLLASLAVGLWAWKRMLSRGGMTVALIAMLAAGWFAGLSILAKFNGMLAIMTLGVWTLLGLALPLASPARKLCLIAGLGLATAVASLTFIALNPFMTAQPSASMTPEALQPIAAMSKLNRFRFLINHRQETSRGQQEIFAHNALTSLPERVKVVAVQGFGRFGPFGPAKSDSTKRYDLGQDWGAFLWLPFVVASFAWKFWMGKQELRESRPPTAWALAAWCALSTGVVTAYLPMAWDRYELPIQAPTCLVVAAAMVSCWTKFQSPLLSSVERS